jgi:uncharacterized protein (DUF2252 family)
MNRAASLLRRIKRFNRDRDPERVALKYKAMSKDAHAFFRGSCHLFYEDWPQNHRLDSAPLVWACGDLHIENFGTYRGDNRLLYFDIADCDEAILAPCTWDLARLLTSALVAARAFGLKRRPGLALCNTFLHAYCWALDDGKARWIERALARGLIKTAFQRVERLTTREFIGKRTARKAGKTVLKLDGKHALPITQDDRERIDGFMRSFAEKQTNPAFFKVLDLARRIAGTGSLGVERYTILIKGQGTESGRFLLDLKATTASALEPYLAVKQPDWKNEAKRVVEVQRRIQAIVPALLQAVTIDSKSYILRELMPTEDKIELKETTASAEELEVLARDTGLVVGWSELRSGGRDGSATIDELQAFSKRRKWRATVVEYAEHYADVAWGDWKSFRDAYQDGAF